MAETQPAKRSTQRSPKSTTGKASVSQYWGAVRLDGEAARSRRSDSGKRHVEDAS